MAKVEGLEGPIEESGGKKGRAGLELVQVKLGANVEL